MPHSHHHKLMHYLLKNKTISEFYFMVGMRKFGFSLISIFLPIYIFLLRNSLADVLVFLTFTYLAVMIFFPIVGKITSRFGNIHTILISAPIMVIFFYLLQTSEPLLIGIPVLGFILGMAEAFFWMPFHEEFSFISKSKEIGKETSIVKIVFSIAGIIAPFIGGLIIVFLGFHLLFLLVLAIEIIGAIPLLFSKEIKSKQKFSLKLAFSKKYKKYYLPFIGSGVTAPSNEWLWPILIFTIVSGFFELGIFSAIINAVGLITLLIFMFKLDKWDKNKIKNFGTVIFSATILARAFVRDAILITPIWALGAISFIFFAVPFDSKIYTDSKHTNKLEFFVVREWLINIGRLLVIGVAFIFVYDLILALTAGIFVAGLLTLLTLKY